MSFLVDFPLPMMWFMCGLETVFIRNYGWEERSIPLPGTGRKGRKTCHWTIYNIWAFGGCVCITADLDMVVCLWLKWTSSINCWHLIFVENFDFLFSGHQQKQGYGDVQATWYVGSSSQSHGSLIICCDSRPFSALWLTEWEMIHLARCHLSFPYWHASPLCL